MVKLWASVGIVCAFALPNPAFSEPCERFVAQSNSADDAERFARTVHQLAVEASAAGCLDQADRLLEGAHHADPNAVHIYARILVREQMGDVRFALELLDGYRSELAGHPAARDLVALDRRLREKLYNAPVPMTAPSEAPRRRATVNALGPIAVGLLGLAAVGLSVYGLTASCALEASDGTCLEGTRTATALTAAYGVVGLAGLSGAGLWWLWTSPADGTHVVLTAAGLHARF